MWYSVIVWAFNLGDSKDRHKGDASTIDSNWAGSSWTLGVAMDVAFDDLEFSLCESCALIFSSLSTLSLQ